MSITTETDRMNATARRQAALLGLPFVALPIGALTAAPEPATLLWALPLASMGLVLARPWFGALARAGRR